jgi:hypothetical protein
VNWGGLELEFVTFGTNEDLVKGVACGSLFCCFLCLSMVSSFIWASSNAVLGGGRRPKLRSGGSSVGRGGEEKVFRGKEMSREISNFKEK